MLLLEYPFYFSANEELLKKDNITAVPMFIFVEEEYMQLALTTSEENTQNESRAKC